MIAAEMHAVIRDMCFDPAKLAEVGGALAEFEAVHAAQPGYAGHIVVGIGETRRVTVTLWETKEDAETGRTELGPRVQRLLEPLLTKPSELLVAGEVVGGDLTRR